MPRTGNKLGSSSEIKDICFCKKVYSHKNKEENLKKNKKCLMIAAFVNEKWLKE